MSDSAKSGKIVKIVRIVIRLILILKLFARRISGLLKKMRKKMTIISILHPRSISIKSLSKAFDW